MDQQCISDMNILNTSLGMSAFMSVDQTSPIMLTRIIIPVYH